MRAMVVRERGGPFVAEERDIPVPGAEEMRIRVQACGVCHSDVVTVQQLFPFIQCPRVPGHEVIGVIDAIGEGVHGWKVGDRAGVGWFGGSCNYCRQCRRDKNVHEISGVTRDGGYATHMIARVSAAAHVPDDLDAVESAPLLCAGVTTFNTLRHTGAGPGDIVAVHGVGGLGHLGSQFAARQGFRTVAVNRGRDKEELARKLGASDYIDTAAQDPAQALTAMGGARAILATARRCRRSPAALAPTA
jgi:D-arabinose 1-dehydrogenase-like Zn-dependent alcohol dehydrogenase